MTLTQPERWAMQLLTSNHNAEAWQAWLDGKIPWNTHWQLESRGLLRWEWYSYHWTEAGKEAMRVEA